MKEKYESLALVNTIPTARVGQRSRAPDAQQLPHKPCLSLTSF